MEGHTIVLLFTKISLYFMRQFLVHLCRPMLYISDTEIPALHWIEFVFFFKLSCCKIVCQYQSNNAIRLIDINIPPKENVPSKIPPTGHASSSIHIWLSTSCLHTADALDDSRANDPWSGLKKNVSKFSWMNTLGKQCYDQISAFLKTGIVCREAILATLSPRVPIRPNTLGLRKGIPLH